MKLCMLSLVLTLFAQLALAHTPPQIKKQKKKTAMVEPDPVFRITARLVFEGRQVRGSIRKSEIDSLLTRRVDVSGAPLDAEYGKYGIGFIYQEGKLPAFSCQEWAQARVMGEHDNLNNPERARESFFVNTCSLLYALKGARPAKRSFIADPQVGLADLKLLPVTVIGGIIDTEAEAALNQSAAGGVRVSDLIARGEVKGKSTKTSVSLIEADGRTELEEAGRADFDGDGIEDIFITAVSFSGLGSARYHHYFLLTRRSPAAGFEARQLDLPALKENPAATTTGLRLKSGELQRLRLARKSDGKGWPFTAQKGQLACVKSDSVAVFWIADGTTYPLNAWAIGSKIDGVTVATDTRDVSNGESLSAIFDKAFAMCPPKGK
jgi:hypothetical protein